MAKFCRRPLIVIYFLIALIYFKNFHDHFIAAVKNSLVLTTHNTNENVDSSKITDDKFDGQKKLHYGVQKINTRNENIAVRQKNKDDLKILFKSHSRIEYLKEVDEILYKTRIEEETPAEIEARILKIQSEEEIFGTPTRINSLNKILNPEFYYYNKMPKCGSTTMVKILKYLSTANKFEILNLVDQKSIKMNQDQQVIDKIIEFRQQQQNDVTGVNKNAVKPFVVIKHHQFINFSNLRSQNLTDLDRTFPPKAISFNLIRHPVHRWVSAYNFCRGGMQHKPVTRKGCADMSADELNIGINNYILTDPWITRRYSWFMSWLSTSECSFCNSMKWSHNQDWTLTDIKKKTANYLKTEILSNQNKDAFYLVGILEEFELSLKLFARLMPRLFGEISYDDILHYSGLKQATNSSGSTRKEQLSVENFDLLSRTAFRYEVDVYNFVKANFHRMIESYNLNYDNE